MLWAITSYFNPVNYRRRLQNYRAFRERLGVPLVTVEWSPAGEFVLTSADADILIQVRGGDILWQKERLLNVALDALPAACDAVAWLDCDIVMGAKDWDERARQVLDRSPLVHLFEYHHDLPPDGGPENISSWDRAPVGRSVAAKAASGETIVRVVSALELPKERPSWGFAWAARRSLLDKHGIYDACIVGGGDAALWCAASGLFERVMTSIGMEEPRRRHYLEWARPFHEDVGGHVGWLSGPLFHLWHGELAQRRYRERHQDMAEFDFDPASDIAISEEGCWRWNSNKPELHSYLEGYFRQRKEDGNT